MSVWVNVCERERERGNVCVCACVCSCACICVYVCVYARICVRTPQCIQSTSLFLSLFCSSSYIYAQSARAQSAAHGRLLIRHSTNNSLTPYCTFSSPSPPPKHTHMQTGVRNQTSSETRSQSQYKHTSPPRQVISPLKIPPPPALRPCHPTTPLPSQVQRLLSWRCFWCWW